jgi:hypothetical protein
MALVNRPASEDVAWCGIGARVLDTGIGSRSPWWTSPGSATALAEAPDLLRPTYSAAIMQAAALAGRAEIVRLLLAAVSGRTIRSTFRSGHRAGDSSG